MRVYIYRREIEGMGGAELYELCCESWRRSGWAVERTTPEQAAKHRLAKPIHDNRKHLLRGFAPGRTAWGMASFEKWLAAAYVAESLGEPFFVATDYDVINYGWEPHQFDRELLECRDQYGSSGIVVFSYDTADVGDTRVIPPTPVCAFVDSANLLLEAFTGYRDDDHLYYKGRRKFGSFAQRAGEMPILNTPMRHRWVQWPIAKIYGDDGWKTAPLVHYMHRACTGDFSTRRFDIITKERPL